MINAGSEDGEGVGSKGNADSTGAIDPSKSTIVENHNVASSNFDVDVSDANPTLMSLGAPSASMSPVDSNAFGHQHSEPQSPVDDES